MPGLGLPDLTGIYDSSVSGQMNLGTTLGALKIDGTALGTGTTGNNDGPIYMEITRGAVNILNTSYNSVDGITSIFSSAIGGMDVGPDPAVLPNRATIRIMPDVLRFLPQDRAFSASVGSGFFRWESTVTMNGGGSIGGFITLDGRIDFTVNASGFGMGNALRTGMTWAGINGANLGPGFVFAGNNTFLADGGATSMSQTRIFFDNAAYSTANGGTLTGGATGHNSLWCGLAVNTGATLALRQGMHFPDFFGVGVVTTQVVVNIPNLVKAGTNIGIRSAMTSGDFIQHNGTARTLLGGDLEVDGAINHDGTTVGLYAAVPVVQAADVGILTLTTGAPDNVLVDVAGTGDDATVNANFADVGSQLNDIRTVLRNIGIMA